MRAIKTTGKRIPWGIIEIEQVISLYNEFLINQRNGTKYSKAAAVRACSESIGRSRGSVECKLMNVSGIRADMGLDIVKGYKALGNSQKLLVDMVKADISNNTPMYLIKGV